MTQAGLPVLPGGVPPEVPYLKLPRAASLFQARAARLRALAEGHVAGDWLLAMAALCDAQRLAAEEIAGAAEPVDVLEFRPVTPLADVSWQGAAGWRRARTRLLDELARAPLPAASRPAMDQAIERIRQASDAEVNGWAGALVGGEAGDRPDAATGVILGAALQVYFTGLAEHLPALSVARAERDCPVCAAPAMAGLVTGDEKVRYLTCSLCATAWHRVRVECATCGRPGGVSYYQIDAGENGSAPGTKAEACSHCHTYLKLFYQEERPYAEPLADDLGTIALDVLLGEAGHARGGLNLLLAA